MLTGSFFRFLSPFFGQFFEFRFFHDMLWITEACTCYFVSIPFFGQSAFTDCLLNFFMQSPFGFLKTFSSEESLPFSFILWYTETKHEKNRGIFAKLPIDAPYFSPGEK